MRALKRHIWTQQILGNKIILTGPKRHKIVGRFSPQDKEIILAHKWTPSKDTDGNHIRLCTTVNGERTPLSHLLLTECPKGYVRDHISRNTLDDRRENLRVVPKGWNQRNMGLSPNNKSGFKGVYKHSKGKWWVACITVNYKNKHLGIFTDVRKGARAYDRAAMEIFGPMARTNKSLGLL